MCFLTACWRRLPLSSLVLPPPEPAPEHPQSWDSWSLPFLSSGSRPVVLFDALHGVAVSSAWRRTPSPRASGVLTRPHPGHMCRNSEPFFSNRGRPVSLDTVFSFAYTTGCPVWFLGLHSHDLKVPPGPSRPFHDGCHLTLQHRWRAPAHLAERGAAIPAQAPIFAFVSVSLVNLGDLNFI